VQFEAVTSGSTLKPGQCLAVGQSITSNNGKISATVQKDGRFIVQHNETKDILFSSNQPSGTTPTKLTVGYNNDVILWGPKGTKLWEATENQTGREAYGGDDDDDARERFSHRPTPGSVELGEKGNLSLYNSNWPNYLLWTSGSAVPGYFGKVSSLKPGETLVIGQKMLSKNGDHELSLLPSGILQLRNTRFNSNAYYFTIPDSKITNAKYLVFGVDTFLEIRDANYSTIWRASYKKRDLERGSRYQNGNSDRPEAPRFKLTDEGSLVAIGSSEYESWSLSELPNGPTLTSTNIGDALRPGTILGPDKYLRSNNGEYVARFGTKGEFALFRGGQMLWRAKASKSDSVWMSDDGNLNVGSGTNSKWQSNTGGNAGKGDLVLVVQDDGNMCIYVGGQPKFATGTAHGRQNLDRDGY